MPILPSRRAARARPHQDAVRPCRTAAQQQGAAGALLHPAALPGATLHGKQRRHVLPTRMQGRLWEGSERARATTGSTGARRPRRRMAARSVGRRPSGEMKKRTRSTRASERASARALRARSCAAHGSMVPIAGLPLTGSVLRGSQGRSARISGAKPCPCAALLGKASSSRWPQTRLQQVGWARAGRARLVHGRISGIPRGDRGHDRVQLRALAMEARRVLRARPARELGSLLGSQRVCWPRSILRLCSVTCPGLLRRVAVQHTPLDGVVPSSAWLRRRLPSISVLHVCWSMLTQARARSPPALKRGRRRSLRPGQRAWKQKWYTAFASAAAPTSKHVASASGALWKGPRRVRAGGAARSPSCARPPAAPGMPATTLRMKQVLPRPGAPTCAAAPS